MKSHGIGRMLRWPLATFPAVVLAILGSAIPTRGADVQMNRPSKTLVEITGGSGPQSWQLRYGTHDSYNKQLVSADENRAWFSHGGWLRLIDTKKGVVIGRWHFPGMIVALSPANNQVQVEVEDKLNDRVFRRTFTSFPSAGEVVPYWPTGNLFLNRVPMTEVDWSRDFENAAGGASSSFTSPLSEAWKILPEGEVKELLGRLEEAVGRDPTAPALRIALWRILREVEDPRAPAVLKEALEVSTTDFTEMLPLAGLLDRLGERAAGRRAFELGYRDFLRRGNDPRLLLTLIGKMIFYQPWRKNPPDLSTDYGRELMERNFRLAPRAEAADFAWQVYAAYLQQGGQTEAARVWRARAREAARTSVFLMPRDYTLLADLLILVILAAIVAAALYATLLSVRYWGQQRAHLAAQKQQGRRLRALSLANFQYWTPSQRVALLTTVLTAWIAVGLFTGIIQGISRAAEMPLSSGMGSLAGPVTVWHLENRLPSTPERDLLLATAYQQSGEQDKAERLYRSLSDFAESWNNLGVLLRSAGKEQQARQAFEKALELDPRLAEAGLNLGRAPQGIWAAQHFKYLPDRSMIAPPLAERWAPVFLGGSMKRILLRALAGPFVGSEQGRLFSKSVVVGSPGSMIVLNLVLATALILAVGLLFLPRWPVTQTPPQPLSVMEALFPGVSPGWGFLGGLVLAAWGYLLLQALLMLWRGTPYILTSIALPSLSRPYGVPGTDSAALLRMINPDWVWVYLAPALLLVVNLGLVLRARRATVSSTSSGQS